MSLLYLDGFDVGDFALKWFVTPHDGNDPVTSSTTPFAAGLSLKIPSDTESVSGATFTNLKRAVPASGTFIGGFQFRWDGSTSVDIALITLYSDSGATAHVILKMRTDGTLDLYRSGGALLASGPASAILEDVWYFIEIKAVISDTGSCDVRVDNATVISFTGDTRNGGTGTAVDAIALNKTGSDPSGSITPNLYYDDLYGCDASGSVNNDFLGMGRVQTLLPSGAGTDTDLTPNPGAPNYDNVNDIPYSTVDYNYSTTPGDRDTYAMSDLSASTATVAGIQTVIIAQSTDASAQVKAALRSGGSVYYDASVVLNATATDASIVVRETDPATSAAWTVSNVNALEAGVEIV